MFKGYYSATAGKLSSLSKPGKISGFDDSSQSYHRPYSLIGLKNSVHFVLQLLNLLIEGFNDFKLNCDNNISLLKLISLPLFIDSCDVGCPGFNQSLPG